MSSEPRRIEEIVRAALTMPADERPAFIHDVCGGDDEMRRRIETWLRIRGGDMTARTATPFAPPASARPPGTTGWTIPLLLILLVIALLGMTWLGLLVAQERERALRSATIAEAEAAQARQRAAPPVNNNDRIVLDFIRHHLLVRDPLEPAEAKIAAIAKDNATLEAILREALGSAYLARGDTHRALVQLQLAAKQRDNPILQARLAEAKEAETRRADPKTLEQLRAQIDAFEKQKHPGKAEVLLRETVGILQDFPQGPLALAIQEVRLGRNLLAQGKDADAEPFLRDGLDLVEKNPPPAAWVESDIRSLLGAALLGQRKYDDAEPFLVAGYKGMKAHETDLPEPVRPRLTEAGKRILALYEAWNKPDKVADWKRRLGP